MPATDLPGSSGPPRGRTRPPAVVAAILATVVLLAAFYLGTLAHSVAVLPSLIE